MPGPESLPVTCNLQDVNTITDPPWGKQPSSPASYHDNVVLGEALGELCHVTPVGRLLAGNDNIWGCYLHALHVSGQLRDADVGFQQLHPLQPPMEGRDVDGLQGMHWFLQDAVDQVHGAILKPEQNISVGFSCRTGAAGTISSSTGGMNPEMDLVTPPWLHQQLTVLCCPRTALHPRCSSGWCGH